jgi:surface protein
MFNYSNFNQPLYKWNTSNVTNMRYMFDSSKFNQPIESWNVANVTNMESMFRDNKDFNHCCSLLEL